MRIGRTLFTKRAAEEDPGLDPYVEDGDGMNLAGLMTGTAWPWFVNASAPYGVLAVGLLALAGSVWAAMAS